ncbi:arginine--tRNA ligase [Candidatus Saccharibacteria bacterium]|nr:arginine--tRNA ligase [Candidatus Saccharibacteria bacterium]
MEKIVKSIQDIIKKLFDVDVEVSITRPDPNFGDYATNVAMQLAKPLGKNPRIIAEELAEALRQGGEFVEVTIAGPGFINLKLTAKTLMDNLNDIWNDNYGHNNDGMDKTVIVEYPSQNMAKPYSIGHLRPGNQGWAAKKLMEVTGWHVIADNHLGDYGAPFGVWVVGFLRYSSDEKLEQGGVYELGRVYIETKKALKEEAARGEAAMANEVQDWLLKLERSDPQALAFSQRFKEISLRHIHEVMQRLKISTDYELGEAFYVTRGKDAVKALLDKNLAIKNDDGSVIVMLDEYGIDTPLLVQKSNGAALYATTDLATLLYRDETWHPDRVIYSVGSEQQFYFSQLFALAKKLGIKTELIHLWFGLIDQINEDGTREKMSSRKGVVLMEELLDNAEKRARDMVNGRDVSDEDIKKIAVGAIKFSDFVSDRRTNILFSWDNIFALSGFSGPYVQYAAVRVNKILKDNQTPQVDTNGYDFVPEKSIILKLLDFPEVIRLAARDLEPHKIAAYLYELARDMNRYYESTPVATGNVTDVEKAARLGLISKVSQVFKSGLDILGIEVPGSM